MNIPNSGTYDSMVRQQTPWGGGEGNLDILNHDPTNYFNTSGQPDYSGYGSGNLDPGAGGGDSIGDAGFGTGPGGSSGGYQPGDIGYAPDPHYNTNNPSIGDNGSPSTGSGGILGDLGNYFLGNGGAGNLGGMQGPITLAALANAGLLFKQAGSYKQLGLDAANRADPFGPQRAGYMTQLHDLQTDPNKYLSQQPSYQAALKQGLAAVDASSAAKGYLGSGNAAVDSQKYGSDLAAQTLNQDRAALMQMAGANFSPATAGSLMMQGGQLANQAQIAGAGMGFLPLMYAAGANQQNQTRPGVGNGSGGGGSSTPSDVKKIISDAIRQSGPSGLTPDGYNYMVKQLTDRGYTPQQAQQFIREGQSGTGDPGMGDGSAPYNPGGGDTGGGGMTVDPSTGDVYDYSGNYVGNINDPNLGGGPVDDYSGGGYGGGYDSGPSFDFGNYL